MKEDKLLSIVILYCDKDYFYLPSLLQQICNKLACSYEVVLVDNRELCKNKPLEIHEFSRHNNISQISSGKNVGQLAAKKAALRLCSSNSSYVWFIDVDDCLSDVITQDKLNSCNEDVIAFNYGMLFDENSYAQDNVVYVNNFNKNCVRSSRSLKRMNEPLQYIGCTCWNKWFKTSILRSFFSLIPDNEVISCGEDVWISSVAINRAKKIRYDKSFVYLNMACRGISNGKAIHSLEDYKKIVQGHMSSYILYEKEFKKPCNLYSRSAKETSNLHFLLERILVCDENIQLDALKLLLEETSLESIKNFLTNCVHNSNIEKITMLVHKLEENN